MKSFEEDIEKQLKLCLTKNRNKEIEKVYIKELRKIFKCIYMINYLSNRIELKRNFQSKYFKVSISCLIEAFDLLINNYARGSSLVLRSALENFIKHILMFYIDIENEYGYEINDRSYTANKTTLDKIIKISIKECLRGKSNSVNSKMETEYKKLSGLSHSLVAESENNTLKYFKDLEKVNCENISLVIEHFIEVVHSIYAFIIIMNEKSFKNWDYHELKSVLRTIFGSSQTKTYLNKLKS